MLVDVWKALLHRIPAEETDNLMLMTAQGTEINLQALLHMDRDYIVLRGRLAGSSDAGRIFVVPYAHLDHIGFQRPLNDALLQTIFGITPAAAPAAVPAEPAAVPVATPQQPAAQPTAPLVPEEGRAAPRLLAKVPTRSKIIQRLRLRAEARDGSTAPPKQ
jgi:hypothetical protein